MIKVVNVLGTRGLPARHGGFESCVAKLAPYLVQKEWIVNVYCQSEMNDATGCDWMGVRRIQIRTVTKGPLATVEFDLRCVLDVIKSRGIDLVFGYNTGVFGLLQRLFGRTLIVNMDGIEWKRQKWSTIPKIWLWLNERIAARICSHAIADHPAIDERLKSIGCKRTTMIAYGADTIRDTPTGALRDFGLQPDRYFLAITRLEPENSIALIVEAFSARARGFKLAILGHFSPTTNLYHRTLKAISSPEVIFTGPIYDQAVKSSLLGHARAYVHGHTVGGTNPSLVEAMGAANAIIVRENVFNRWTAGEDQFYFTDRASCEHAIERAINDLTAVECARQCSGIRHSTTFTWEQMLRAYENLLTKHALARVGS